MKTIIVWNTFQEFAKFVVLDGDYRHLDEVCVGSVGDEDKQEELMQVLNYNDETGLAEFEELKEFPLDVVRGESEVYVINAGFIP